MGHTLSIDAVINIIFGIAMTAIGVITIAQTAHLARLCSRSTDRSPWAPPLSAILVPSLRIVIAPHRWSGGWSYCTLAG